MAIPDQIVVIVKDYVRNHKQWNADSYHIDPNAKKTPDGHLLVTVVHHDDLKPRDPNGDVIVGGGMSIQLEIDQKQMIVVREFRFQ